MPEKKWIFQEISDIESEEDSLAESDYVQTLQLDEDAEIYHREMLSDNSKQQYRSNILTNDAEKALKKASKLTWEEFVKKWM